MIQEKPAIKSYLIQAIHKWCTDCGFTPHLLVLVTPDVRVPNDFVKNGEILLNISNLATSKLEISGFEITFVGRFGGKAQQVVIPVFNVLSIFAKENGQGISFEISTSKITDRSLDETENKSGNSLKLISDSMESERTRKKTKTKVKTKTKEKSKKINAKHLKIIK